MEDRTYLIIAIASSVIFIVLGTIIVYLYYRYVIITPYGTAITSFIVYCMAGYSLYRFFMRKKHSKTKQKIPNVGDKV